ncbi:MAG TPA: SAM-dependent methyltransferase [Woeseiaceae bacterium]|nr:SAM-dependent methyltransferase [Woeseiaceae bacterium]
MQAKPAVFDSLPVPGSESLLHTEKVAARIRQAIVEAGGSISFAEFMQLALYAPGLGYYSAGAAKFGAAGDFVTAPEISPLFGRVLARQCAGVLRQLAKPAVLELGPGTGALALQVLTALEERGMPPERYLILEVSPDLRERQEQRLRRAQAALSTKIEWITALPERFDGVVIANEVADALPVERFRKAGRDVLQCRVAYEEDRFRWTSAPAPDFLREAVHGIESALGTPLPDGYVSEVSAGLPAWVADVTGSVGTGLVFLFDYGITRREYYAPDRSGGWLRCHFRHRAHDDPLIYPGIQDITAWIDFTAVAEAAVDAGMDIAGFVSQAHFLLHGGLEEEFARASSSSTSAQAELSRQAGRLILPGEMGERFKCIGLSRGSIDRPQAFAAADRAHAL